MSSRDSGHVRVGEEFITLSPTGEFSTVKDFENLLIRAGDKQFYLKEVANVRRGYVDPRTEIIRYDGHPAIALGISTVAGGNVVTMGDALREKMKELAPHLPVGDRVRHRLHAIGRRQQGDQGFYEQPAAGGRDRDCRARVLHGASQQRDYRRGVAGYYYRQLHLSSCGWVSLSSASPSAP